MKKDENMKIDQEDEKTWKRYGLSRSVMVRYGPLRSVTVRYGPLQSVTVRYGPLTSVTVLKAISMTLILGMCATNNVRFRNVSI